MIYDAIIEYTGEKAVYGSKIALILLSEFLEKHDFLMIDCQFHTNHLESMGGEKISWEEYRNLLDIGF